MLGITRPCRVSMQERKQLLLTCCSSTRANGNSGRALAAQELGSFWGENGPTATCPREQGSVLLLSTSPPSACCCARRRKPSPHPLCSRAVQKAAGSCRETACLACRRERGAKAVSCHGAQGLPSSWPGAAKHCWKERGGGWIRSPSAAPPLLPV